MKSFQIILFFLLAYGSLAYAQLPNSQIYAVSFTQTGDNFSFRDVKYLTNFNNPGYNNQPNFVSNRKIQLVSNYYNKDNNDIIELDLQSQKMYRFTDTKEAEYSPLPMPNSKYISCVRVFDDEQQLLWAFPKSRQNTGASIIDNLSNVGYYAWLSEEEIAMFLVGTPHKLVIHNIESEERKEVIDNIGRCLKVNSDGKLIFIHKMNDEFWFLKSYDPSTEQIETIVQTFSKNEDFEILRDGSILMGEKSFLYRYNPADNKAWVEIGNFKKYGINSIKRITSRGNKIVMVNE